MNKFTSVCCLLVVVIQLHPAVNAEVFSKVELQVGATKNYRDQPPRNLTVWMIPHSHDDTGWLSTVDEYYVKDVNWIISSVVDALRDNKNRKFSIVEMAFFYRWWQEQNEGVRNATRALVQNGQLEFNLGGWCMPDEAGTTYSSIIDLMTLGHQFILSEFGQAVRPRTAWHVDPFGHTSTIISLYKQMGFDAFGLTRMNYIEKQNRINNQSLEFLWRTSKSLGAHSDMFTYIMDKNSYGTPDIIDFSGKQINGDSRLPTFGEEDMKNDAVGFADIAHTRATAFRTDNLLIPFGNDFQHSNAVHDFINMDRLIRYINKNQNVYNMSIKYGTLTDYVKAVHSANMSWQVQGPNKDFMGYYSSPNTWWSGYFTSRPLLKGNIRRAEQMLRSTEMLYSLAAITRNFSSQSAGNQLFFMRRAVGVVQHHDAITGTERAHTVNDYNRILQMGMDGANEASSTLHSSLLGDDGQSFVGLSSNATNQTVLPAIPLGSGLPMILFNDLGWNRVSTNVLYTNQTDLIVVILDSINVTSKKNTTIVVPSQINPVIEGDDHNATHQLVFSMPMAPLSQTMLYVVSNPKLVVAPKVSTVKQREPVEIASDYYSLHFSELGLLTEIKNLVDSTSMQVTQNLAQYIPAQDSPASGAYVFRPDGNQLYNVTNFSNASQALSLHVITGPVTIEVHQVFRQAYVQTWRLWRKTQVHSLGLQVDLDLAFVDLIADIGPLDPGHELVSKFSTDIDSNGTFFTDSNGLEMMQRQYNDTLDEPIAGNYYPIVNRAYIRDTKREFVLLADRAHGVTSLQSGEIEVMLHRRCLSDDEKGLNQVLDPVDHINPALRLVVAPLQTSSPLHRRLSILQNSPAMIMIGSKPINDVVDKEISNRNSDNRRNKRFLETHFMSSLPPEIHLLSLQQMYGRKNHTLLRLMHIFEQGELFPGFEETVTIDLRTTFPGLEVTKATPMSLSGNIPAEQMEAGRLQWKRQNNPAHDRSSIGNVESHNTVVVNNTFAVTLTPMKIVTLLINADPEDY